MTDACLIELKGKYYFYKNENNEVPELFIKRCWFLAKNQGKYSSHILNTLSHAWIQQIYYGVSYDEKINTLLKSILL